MAKILYIHQYFRTPNEPGGTRSYWISQELIKDGHTVTMITSRNDQIKKIERQNIDGIDVLYIRNAYGNDFSILKRVISFLRFMSLSFFLSLNEKNIDLIYATSTPLTVAIPAILNKWFRKITYIFEVRDLWPEVPIQMGALKNYFFRSSALYLEKLSYSNSDFVIALSPGMKQGVLNVGIQESKVEVVPNMAKIDKFYSRIKTDEDFMRFGLDKDKFYVIHFGALGLANGVEYIIEAARILNKNQNNSIEFLFAGGGSQESVFKNKCRTSNIKNVRFLGNFNMDNLSILVNLSSCSIVSFANIPILNTNSPNKLFDSLSAQKPVIVNSSGWTKDLVESSNCGSYVNPENPMELVDLLIEWSNNPEIIEEMGLNARKLAQSKYDKSILAKKVVQVVNKVLK